MRLCRFGVRLLVEPSRPATDAIALAALTYERRDSETDDRGRSRVHESEATVYFRDHRGCLCTFAGYRDRLEAAFKAAGVPVRFEQGRHPRPGAYETNWEKVFAAGYKFRPKQDLVLALAACHDHTKISCPPGWGKGTVAGAFCLFFPNAKIAVVTKNTPVLTRRLYPEIAGVVPNVGLVYGAKHRFGRRVDCVSAGCLHRVDGASYDWVVADEVDQLGTDNYSSLLARFINARFIGMTASHDVRFDNGDFRLEGLFGPIRLKVSVQEAVDQEMVAQTRVMWRRIPAYNGENPVRGLRRGTSWFKRKAYWEHHYRNAMIARDARSYGPEVQALVYAHVVQHALHLRRRLPEFHVVHAAGERKGEALNMAVEDRLPPMTVDRLGWLTRGFEKSTVKKAIVTTCWNAGVNFPRLQVLLRADGSDSRREDIQVPGRAARLVDGKPYAIIHDYWDEFDAYTLERSKQRRLAYDEQGFQSIEPPGGLPNEPTRTCG